MPPLRAEVARVVPPDNTKSVSPLDSTVPDTAEVAEVTLTNGSGW